MLDCQLISSLESKVLETYLRAEQIWNRSFQLPTIEFKNLGRTAGKAFYAQNKIIYSPVLFTENVDRFLNRTVPHEIAHLITKVLYPNAKQHHGPEWRYVMQKLGIEDNTRCHSYDISSVSRRNTKIW